MPTQTTSDYETWASAALAVESDAAPVTNVPLHVLFGEAVDVARFFAKYWEPVMDGAKVVRRGLSSAAGPKSRIQAATGDEILSLQRGAQDAQTRYRLTVHPASQGDPRERGQFLLDELTATLEWHFDDGVEDDNDRKLASLDAAHADDPDTLDALASALDDYAALAEPHRAALDGLGGFEASYVDEAREVAKALREQPSTPAPMSDEAKAAVAMRNKMMTLLWARMSAVRAAARFVFRDRPEIVREATSAYERRRRAASRRAKAKKGATGGEGGATP